MSMWTSSSVHGVNMMAGMTNGSGQDRNLEVAISIFTFTVIGERA